MGWKWEMPVRCLLLTDPMCFDRPPAIFVMAKVLLVGFNALEKVCHVSTRHKTQLYVRILLYVS